jgi:hypothetical protein
MVRPVDLQDNFSKAPLVGREQHLQQTDAQIAQRQAAQDLSQQHILDHSRTRPAEQQDRVDLRLDDREGQRQDPGDQRRRPPAEESADAPAEGNKAPGSGPSRHLDVTA